jgi:L-malate glycosyltransferase
LKVLHLIQKPQLRGAEVFASQLSSHINQSGNTAIIVSIFNGKANLPFRGSINTLNGNPGRRMFDFAAWKKLAQIIREEMPDIIQANAGDTLKYAVFSKLFYRWRQPIVFRNASTISLYIKTLPQRVWNNFQFRFTERIISVSNASANDFSRLFPAHKHKVVTIPIGIEHTVSSKGSNGMINGHLKSDGKQLKIVHVGGFSFEKNHSGLVEIFELVLQKVPSATLRLVGDGPLKKQTEQLARSKGLDKNIVFCGFQADPMQYIRNADVLVLPSIIEGLPGVILEAFYCKIPVVAYDVGGVREIVRNDDTGRLVKKGDQKEFADKIIEASFHTPQNDALVENAHKLVLSKYLNTQVAKEFMTVYQSIV